MPEKGIRSTYSQCPFEIQMWDDQGIISTGTAFFYEFRNRWFFVTNWHNFSGRHFVTKCPLSYGARTPTYIKAKFATILDSKGSFTTVARKVHIYENLEPLWLEHPEIGSMCDVVALPMKRPQNCPDFWHNAANRVSQDRIPVEPGCTVFIIGFPRSISVGIGLPLWKSGYIASEPHYDVTIGGMTSELGGLQNGNTLPAFFIDSQTREGMSGSPVFALYVGAWDMSNPYGPIDGREPGFWERDDVVLSGRAMEFIGCYSGRVGMKEEGAALGLCWRKDIIEEICAGNRIGKHPHVG